MRKRKISSLFVAVMVGFASFVCSPTLTEAEDSTAESPGQNDLLQVTVYQLIVEATSNQPVVILADSSEARGLPIWISPFEANAIHSEMQGIQHGRPLTHDLLERIMQGTDVKVRRIVITHIKDNIFYATIFLENGGSILKIDARPSDSIVMALKFNAPIFVARSLFTAAAVPLVTETGVLEKYGLKLQPMTPPLAKSFHYPATGGLLVADVSQGSQAQRDGLQRGDILAEVNGQAIETTAAFGEALTRGKTDLQTKIFRKAEYLSLTLHLH
ncbi:bifunctional nuclease domain-containing protein [Thermodesulfobacteriota bacterium]